MTDETDNKRLTWEDVGIMACQLALFLCACWGVLWVFAQKFDGEWLSGLTIALVLIIARFLGIDPGGVVMGVVKRLK